MRQGKQTDECHIQFVWWQVEAMHEGFTSALKARDDQLQQIDEQIIQHAAELQQQYTQIGILRELATEWDRGSTIGVEHKVSAQT